MPTSLSSRENLTAGRDKMKRHAAQRPGGGLSRANMAARQSGFDDILIVQSETEIIADFKRPARCEG